jgi:hypothetical protein
MLQFVVDWLSRADTSEPIEVELPVVVRDASAILQFRQRQQDIASSPTPRERGIRFHQEEFARLFEAVERWPSVEFLTAGGLPVGAVDELPKSADGGIDVIVRIVAPTERGARNIAGRLRNMIVSQSYE